MRHPNHVSISTLVIHLEGGEEIIRGIDLTRHHYLFYEWYWTELQEEIISFLGKIIDDTICTREKHKVTHESELLSRPANSAMLRISLGSWQNRKTATITRRIREKLRSVVTLFLTTFHSRVYCCGFQFYLSVIDGATTALLVVLSLFLAAFSPWNSVL